MKISLNGKWSVESSDGKFRTEMNVPGDVFSALVDAGLMPHPYERRNELSFRKLESLGWILRREFKGVRGERVELVFDGIDTVADVYLNGVFLGRTQNMFLQYRFDVTDVLKGENFLEVVIHPAVEIAKNLERTFGKVKSADVTYRSYIRKAQYSFGWDWGPRLVSAGIWRDVYLETLSGGRVHGSFAYLRNGRMRVEGLVDLFEREEGFEVEVFVDGEEVGRVPVRSDGCFEVETSHVPSLWYPRGLGEQNLHTLEVRLLKDEEVKSVERKRFGLREVVIERVEDGEGESFIFRINGERVFVKGANWIPVEALLGWRKEEDYRKLLEIAADAGMNMIRVWGGGVYEDDIFYDLCDELGLMVWQDFMFACAEYPDHLEWFRNLAVEEAKCNVVRLRHHPSIVLWCGNNECNWGFDEWGFDTKVNGINLGNRLYLEEFPKVISELSPSTPYWPSSPYGGKTANDSSVGDVHFWDVWSGWRDWREYEKKGGRFVSEFGFQSSPSLQALKVIGEGGIFSDDVYHHNKQVEGMERIVRYLAAEFGRANFDRVGIFLLTQFLQAEAVKAGVERWRSRKYKTAGVLFWQLNDVWPVFSWSAIDYLKNPKALYHYSKIFYSDVLPLISANELFVVNDLKSEIEGTLKVRIWKADGTLLKEKEYHLFVPKDSALLVDELDGDGDIAQLVFESGVGIWENHKLLKKVRQMNLKKSLRWRYEDGEVILECDSPVLGVWIDSQPQENFLVLFPGERRVNVERAPEVILSVNDIIL